MPPDHKWSEITDLPEDVRSLTNDEVRPLHRFWQQQKDSLAIGTALEEFNGRLKREWAIHVADVLKEHALERLIYAADRLTAEITAANPAFHFGVAAPELGETSWHGYNVNPAYRKSLSLRLADSRLVISFYAVGLAFRGIIAGVAILLGPDQTMEAIGDGPFQINYEEDEVQAKSRFGPWLEKSIVRGITLWQQSAGQ